MKTFLKYFLIVIALAIVSIIITFLMRILKGGSVVEKGPAVLTGSSKEFPEIERAKRDEVLLVVPKDSQKDSNELKEDFDDDSGFLDQQEKEKQDNASVDEILEKIKNNYALDNLNNTSVAFEWISIDGESKKNNKISGKGFTADGNLQHIAEIEQFLREQGFGSSKENSRDDDRIKINGFGKENLVCLVTAATVRQDVTFELHEQEAKMEVRCGVISVGF
ncbi:MAG: hypothetical protein U9O20_00625 [Patescibacteria group bacterium]|nr:hypothetical protein [Patescibacteria group bacterium]